MRANPAAVGAWYIASDRWDEQVSSIRGQGVSDLNERAWEADGKLVRELTWTCRHGHPGLLRFATVQGPSGVLLPIAKGFQVQREQISHSHSQTGRQVVIDYQSVFEFRGFEDLAGSLANLTEIVAVHRQVVTGGPWWESVLPPITARLQTEKRAKESASRCESELAGATSADSESTTRSDHPAPSPTPMSAVAERSATRSGPVQIVAFTVLVALAVLTWGFHAAEPIPALFAVGAVLNILVGIRRRKPSRN